MKSHYLLAIPILASSLGANAEVTLDGTLGRGGALPGPNYLIGADLGRQHGGNLFHSFKDFNLNRLESATFSGPNSLNNIISRVTGGNPSNIDGLIRSAIPADMYFLNPNGIMFGPNAQLDVQGSFHASTADYLRLGENGRFDARLPSDSLLTVAPVAAFGFLTDSPKSISTQDSKLSVPYGQTLSLIGGDLSLNGNSPVMFDEGNFMAISARSILSAQGGRVNLASAASRGEIIPSELELELNTEGGQINIDKTLIETSGAGSGAVFIRGEQLVMQDTTIQANTMGNENGKGIDLKLTESINISGNLQAIKSESFGSGNAGNLTISVPDLEIKRSRISTRNYAQGDGGDIDIETIRIKMNDGGLIGSGTYGIGKGSNFNIKATESISLLGENSDTYIYGGVLFINYPTNISTSSHIGTGGQLNIEASQINMAGGIIGTASFGEGDSGDISLYADTINMSDGSFVSSSGLSSGQVGNIDINVTNKLSLSGRRNGSYITPTGMEFKDLQSNISSFGLARSGGNISISAPTLRIDNEAGITASTLGAVTAETIGNINLEVGNLSITQGGQINNSNGVLIGRTFFAGPGQGGAIQIQAKNMIIDANKSGLPTGIFSDTYSSGIGGNVDIQTDHLAIANDGAISARSNDTGNAGSLTVQADIIKLINQGNISTEAENAAGGNINVETSNLLYLHKAGITTSVGTGKGKGGDISITNPTFITLNQGQIKTQADAGQGGNIRIVADQFITSPDSLISASSKLGIDGNVQIDSPAVDMDAMLVVLPGGHLEAQLPKKCRYESVDDINTFYIYPEHEGKMRNPDDFIE